MSPTWSLIFRGLYRMLAWLDPLLRSAHQAYGIGNFVELRLPGRRTGRPITTLLGLLRSGGQIYLGHPNGDCAWTRNLEAAGGGELADAARPASGRGPGGPPGSRRGARGRHPIDRPAPVSRQCIYRLGRRHVLAVGTYFRLEPLAEPGLRAAPPRRGPVSTNVWVLGDEASREALAMTRRPRASRG